MPKRITQTPINYRQPDLLTEGFNQENTVENVSYVSNSHARIWYNHQNETYELHHHGALEIIICNENTYEVIANSKSYQLNVGDILFVPPHMLHELHPSEDGTRFICLIDIEMLSFFQDFKTMDPIFMNAYLCNAKLCPEIYQSIYSMFMEAFDIYFKQPIFWETQIYSLLIKIFSLIGSDHYHSSSKQQLNNGDEKPREHYEKIAALLNYLDTVYATEITLEEAANYIGFSKYHFTRLFKQYTNTTFYDYLCHKRISAAQQLLSSDMPITEIAFQVGFNNVTSFCRCFKKLTNCSPSEYRNKFQHPAGY